MHSSRMNAYYRDNLYLKIYSEEPNPINLDNTGQFSEYGVNLGPGLLLACQEDGGLCNPSLDLGKASKLDFFYLRIPTSK